MVIYYQNDSICIGYVVLLPAQSSYHLQSKRSCSCSAYTPGSATLGRWVCDHGRGAEQPLRTRSIATAPASWGAWVLLLLLLGFSPPHLLLTCLARDELTTSGSVHFSKNHVFGNFHLALPANKSSAWGS